MKHINGFMQLRIHLHLENTREMNERFVEQVITALLNDEIFLFHWSLAVELAVLV